MNSGTADGSNCSKHRECASKYCNSGTSKCEAIWGSSDNCSSNSDKCGLDAFCLTAGSLNRCRYKSSVGGPCSAHNHCESGNCSGTICGNPTGGFLSGQACTIDSECASGACFQPRTLNTCQKFIPNGEACDPTSSTDYCGPGYFCSRTSPTNTALGLCKQMFIGSYTLSPPQTPRECPQNNLNGNSCQDVTVRANNIILSYPYKAAAGPCLYLESFSGGSLFPTNGYCPIAEGVKEHKDYLRAAVLFLSSSEL